MKKLILIVSMMMFGILSSCSTYKHTTKIMKPDTVLMTVNGIPIYQHELDTELSYMKTYRTEPDRELIDEILGRQLIRLAAMRSLFAENLDAMRDEMIELRKRIVEGGEDFATLAEGDENNPTVPNGGELGEYTRFMMVEPFSRTSFTIEPGTVSEPFLTVYGWHILEVTRGIQPNEEGLDSVEGHHILKIFCSGEVIRKVIYTECLNAEIEVHVPRYRRAVSYGRHYYTEQLEKVFERERTAREDAAKEPGEQSDKKDNDEE